MSIASSPHRADPANYLPGAWAPDPGNMTHYALVTVVEADRRWSPEEVWESVQNQLPVSAESDRSAFVAGHAVYLSDPYQVTPDGRVGPLPTDYSTEAITLHAQIDGKDQLIVLTDSALGA